VKTRFGTAGAPAPSPAAYGPSVLRITGFDHLVLRCRDVDTSLRWYVDELGLEPVRVEQWRDGAAPFPSVRLSAESIIDLIPADGPFSERNVDHFCVVADRASVDAVAAGAGTQFNVVAGPVTRFGAKGDGWSVYVTDPDDNMVEIRTYEE
jgi:catechol 2,3-dioxygenase-like lactoylglutathione lyase family enzyme